MVTSDGWPEPESIGDAASFVAGLRQMRERSGFTYRQLERRAADAGDKLPSSTMGGVLARNTLPRADLLAAFVRACGGGAEEIARWSAARARLAAKPTDAAKLVGQVGQPASDPAAAPTKPAASAAPAAPGATGPISAQARPGRWSRLARSIRLVPGSRLALGIAVVAGMVAVSLVSAAVVMALRADRPTRTSTAVRTGDPSAPGASALAPPASAPPASGSAATPSADGTAPGGGPAPLARRAGPQPLRDGRYRIKLAHTGLCVGEGEERFTGSGRLVLGQYGCASASPPTRLVRVPGAATYRIELSAPVDGTGCATVDYGGSGVSLLLARRECGPDRPDQQFILEPVTTPAVGYRLRSKAGELYCVGVLDGSRSVGVQLIQDPCRNDAAQVFTFSRF